MNNRQVAGVFNKLSKIMDLHGENPFKTRSYSAAYNTIRRYETPVLALAREELLEIKGIGKNITDKIEELRDTGTLGALQKYIDITPPGIVEMLDIKGLGAKKILTVWKDLGIESPGELLYACHENRLVELKGFGQKTQKSIVDSLEYYLDGKGKYLYGHVISEAQELLDLLRAQFGKFKIEIVKGLARKMPVVDGLEYLMDGNLEKILEFIASLPDVEVIGDDYYFKGSKVIIDTTSTEDFNHVKWELNASDEFLDYWNSEFEIIHLEQAEELVFRKAGMTFIPPECRESEMAIHLAEKGLLPIIENQDIRGIIHTHTTYSDGTHTIREMAQACIDRGYQYLVISDHSQTAVYANGLKTNRVLEQMEEIDQLNKEFSNFKIFKSIESDILTDGSLDYSDDFLQNFDLVIASVHSVLKMTKEKATDRLLNAIRHPATKILGHMTGRLLLSRPGYPVDHMKIIEACAEHNVAIELNANPYRLDMDWTWIPYAMEREVLISINPDAHSIGGIDDVRFGVAVARKALLTPEQCLNTFSSDDFEKWFRTM